MFLVSGCSSKAEEDNTKEEGKYADIEQELSEKLGADVRILEPDGYSLLRASLFLDEGGGYREAGLAYGMVEGDEEVVESSNKLAHVEYVYGPYRGNYDFRTAIQPRKDDFEIESFAEEAEMEVTEIEGQQVAYFEIDMMPRQLRATIPFENFLYSLVIPIEGEGTGIPKESAFDYIEKLIQEYQNG